MTKATNNLESRMTGRGPRRALTLVEILVAVSILLVLFGVVIVTGRITRDSRKLSTAQQQMAQVSAAINQYATFWPAWNINGTLHAVKGWPDFIAGRLFPTSAYSSVAGFNDYLDLLAPSVGADNLLNANACLFYSLSSASGKGPYLQREGRDDVKIITAANGSALFYPSVGTGAEVRQQILDPWGTPLRYFWVYRAIPPVGQFAYRGFLPITTANSADVANFRIADGFVLESAGPNKAFGNQWKLVPDPLPPNFEATDSDIRDASDNLIVSP